MDQQQEDTKWIGVFSKSKELLYYCNKITGQQRWTSQNCLCLKIKSTNVGKVLSPCCIKETSAKEKVATQHWTPKSTNETSKEVYSLSDIIKEIKPSLIFKKRKRGRPLKLGAENSAKNLKKITSRTFPVSVAKTPVMKTDHRDTEKTTNANITVKDTLKRKREESVINGYKLRPRPGFKFAKYCAKNKAQKLRDFGNDSGRSESQWKPNQKATLEPVSSKKTPSELSQFQASDIVMTAISLPSKESTSPLTLSSGKEKSPVKDTTELRENDGDVFVAARELLSRLPNTGEKRVENVQEVNIRFVSDENLCVGGKGSSPPGQKFLQINPLLPKQAKKPDNIKAFARLESIIDSLKETSANRVKRSSSDWAGSWSTKVAKELDDLKKIIKLSKINEVRRKTMSYPGSESNSELGNSPLENHCTRTSVSESSSQSSPDVKPKIQSISHINSAEITRSPSCNIAVDEHTTQRGLKRPDVTTEVHASFVDLSWRIVTSNGGDSSSLKNFYKLVPVREKSSTNDETDVFSFLGVPVYGDGQVIAKILDTDVPEEENKVYVFEQPPAISRSYQKGRITLSFQWDHQAVVILPKVMPNSKKPKLTLLNPPVREHTVSLVLPKPLQLPKAGCKVFLGDFSVQAISGEVEFNVGHSVTVSKSPRTSLTIPPAALEKSQSKVFQQSRCRIQGVTREDVENAQSTPSVIPSKPLKLQSKPCSMCGVALYSSKDVRRHRRIHESAGGIKCSECTRRLPFGRRLSLHIDTHKSYVEVECQKCKGLYKVPKTANTVLAEYHLKLCLTCRKEFKCKKCALRFFSLDKLREHTLKAHYLKCGVCEESFLYKRNLNKHIKTRHKITSSPPTACISSLSR